MNAAASKCFDALLLDRKGGARELDEQEVGGQTAANA